MRLTPRWSGRDAARRTRDDPEDFRLVERSSSGAYVWEDPDEGDFASSTDPTGASHTKYPSEQQARNRAGGGAGATGEVTVDLRNERGFVAVMAGPGGYAEESEAFISAAGAAKWAVDKMNALARIGKSATYRVVSRMIDPSRDAEYEIYSVLTGQRETIPVRPEAWYDTAFFVRSSAAGVEMPKRDQDRLAKIVKKYSSFRVEYQADKGTGLSLSDQDFQRFMSEVRSAGLTYLIERE